MSVLILLLIASITIAGIFLVAFLWSVKSGQYDDEVSPPMRMLFDDATPKEKEAAPPKIPAASGISVLTNKIKIHQP